MEIENRELSKNLIDSINSLKQSICEISVYDINYYSMTELYYNIANKLNEVIKECYRYEVVVSEEIVRQNECLQYLLNEGLKNEVIDKINEMNNNGVFDSIINHTIFNELNNKLDIVVNKVGNIRRKFKPLVCNNLWFINRTEEQMRNIINNQITMGIEGFILCFHLNLNSSKTNFDVSENVQASFNVAKEFIEQGVYFSAIKIHCTDSELASDTNVQEKYKNTVLSITSKFSSLNISKCILFNERYDVINDNNATYVNNLINTVKNQGYKVSINANSRTSFVLNYINNQNITSNYDFTSCNIYPKISTKGRNTTLKECVNAWERETNFNNYLTTNKEFILTETGMRPYWNYFASPAAYQYDYPSENDINAQLLYIEGVFNSAINHIASEIWLWFIDDSYNDELKKLIKSYTNEGGN